MNLNYKFKTNLRTLILWVFTGICGMASVFLYYAFSSNPEPPSQQGMGAMVGLVLLLPFAAGLIFGIIALLVTYATNSSQTNPVVNNTNPQTFHWKKVILLGLAVGIIVVLAMLYFIIFKS